jgi:hypothetical protein
MRNKKVAIAFDKPLTNGNRQLREQTAKASKGIKALAPLKKIVPFVSKSLSRVRFTDGC